MGLCLMGESRGQSVGQKDGLTAVRSRSRRCDGWDGAIGGDSAAVLVACALWKLLSLGVGPTACACALRRSHLSSTACIRTREWRCAVYVCAVSCRFRSWRRSDAPAASLRLMCALPASEPRSRVFMLRRPMTGIDLKDRHGTSWVQARIVTVSLGISWYLSSWWFSGVYSGGGCPAQCTPDSRVATELAVPR